MIHWIKVDSDLRQIGHFDDATFPFGVYRDDYSQMEDNTLPLHWHEAFEFDYVEQGQVRMTIGADTVLLSPGDCAYINANTLHGACQQTGYGDAKVLSICFTPEVFTSDKNSTIWRKFFGPAYALSSFGFKVDTSRPEGIRLRDTAAGFSCLDKTDFCYQLNVLSHLSMLCAALHDYVAIISPSVLSSDFIPMMQRKEIRRILAYIEENYAKKITVEELAEVARISRSECFRCFRQFTGKTPIAYLNDYRLSRATLLLSGTDKSIVEVCLSCGFVEQSYFGSLFRRKFGCSPSEYRQKSGSLGERD